MSCEGRHERDSHITFVPVAETGLEGLPPGRLLARLGALTAMVIPHSHLGGLLLDCSSAPRRRFFSDAALSVWVTQAAQQVASRCRNRCSRQHERQQNSEWFNEKAHLGEP